MTVIAIRKGQTTARKNRVVEANQQAMDALTLNSGTWRVKGIPGLYVRCRAKSKSFMLQRRVDGQLVKETLGQLSMKEARGKAMERWSRMKSKPSGGALILGIAIEQYIDAKTLAKKMAPKSEKLVRYNTNRYLAKWKDRALADIGKDRAGLRALQQQITRLHGRASSNQIVRLLSAVYHWCRDVDDSLPEWPRRAAEIHKIKPRDWAFSDEELRAWWHAVVEKDGERVERGVSTLGPVKKMWWLTALLTGARAGSVEALRWDDLDFDRNVIQFKVTKGDRPYRIPMADALAKLMGQYRDSGEVPPSPWVFPSPAIEGAHLLGVKNVKQGVGPAHRLRHTFRTTLAELGVGPDQARMLMGHAMGGDVSRDYITAPLVVESLRPVANAVAERYMKILGQVVK